MDNRQIPPVQPMGTPVQQATVVSGGMPMVQQVRPAVEPKKNTSGLIKTIYCGLIDIAPQSLVNTGFEGLYVHKLFIIVLNYVYHENIFSKLLTFILYFKKGDNVIHS